MPGERQGFAYVSAFVCRMHLLTLEQVHFFAHLTVAGVISPQSMYELLKSFIAVLEEFSVSSGRASKACLCAAEGLIIVSRVKWMLIELQ